MTGYDGRSPSVNVKTYYRCLPELLPAIYARADLITKP